MHSALKPILRAALFYLLSVLAIAGVLVAGGYLVDAVKGAVGARERLALLTGVQGELARYRQDGGAALQARLATARELPLAALDERIRGVSAELAAHTAQSADERGELAILLDAGPERYATGLAARYQARLAQALLQQELAYLQGLRGQLLALQSRAAAAGELARLHAQHRSAYDRVLRKRQEIAQLGWIEARRMEHPWARSPRLDKLAAELKQLTAENNRLAAAWRAQAQALQRMRSVSALTAFALDERQLDRVLAPLQEQVATARAAVAEHWLTRIAEPFKRVLPLACAILAMALLGRAAIRAAFYFVLAPLVTRGPPLRLERQGDCPADGEGVEVLAPSAVSQTLRLRPDEELLVLPAYLQSAPVGAARSTRWLVKERPWASLTSGMALLTCVRSSSPEEAVVLSASDDGLSEIALLRVPPGQALVIQPRALVGLVARQGHPLDIRWRWRLASLHAWLTLQLRFFVIRGPVTLAVQGKRGVRVQPARGTQSIRQTATLGFSTSVAYSTVRSEPFLPYLRGQAPLLNDRFGGAGVYLYDETPGAGNRQGRIGRGLEGLSDALLKLFGY
ncbi:hypothetical protein LK540_25100 [Massilia sp. IC2-278]|uniref:hypothetical protein n=1 Tax=Massilia sp. IC2-278 TaxID=2887200 RepID=UPI001E4DA989|nr:hypothetical protein [Massilia sp. IC2-278]MCC2963718.1 hypothetical protein [Massilia sp. IC2-278]